MTLPPPTLPSPSEGLKTGRRMPPLRPPQDRLVSTGIRSAGMGDSAFGVLQPLPAVALVLLAVFVAAPFAAWALYLAAQLPIWAWYASLFPH